MANKYICTDIHTVQAGDTLYSVSQRYNVDVELLMRVNRIRNPYNLRIGTRLCIPGLANKTPVPAPLPEVDPDQPQDGASGPDTTPSPGRCQMIHIVEEGDTLYLIARRYKVTLENLMNANTHIDPYNMKIGMEICIPQ